MVPMEQWSPVELNYAPMDPPQWNQWSLGDAKEYVEQRTLQLKLLEDVTVDGRVALPPHLNDLPNQSVRDRKLKDIEQVLKRKLDDKHEQGDLDDLGYAAMLQQIAERISTQR